jgi:Fe-S oxidoreductase
VPLLQKLPGPKRIAEFIEDVTVHPDQLANYMSTLSGILRSHDVQGIMYGHAGDGNIHTRPILNLKDSKDLATMQSIMDEVMDFVSSIKGTPSGEHGDGLSRSPYISRFYGEEVYDIFKQVKAAFDPSGILNPGKKVVSKAEAGGLATNMRYGANYWTYEQSTMLDFPDGEYEREIEKCHGCAECKSLVGTTMCPTFKATRREHASPRAKANLLRNVITGKLDPGGTYALAAAKEVTDYCIECGMCAVECPSNVNIPKLMLEAKSEYRKAHRPNNVDLVMSRLELVSKAGHLAAPLANPLVNQPFLRSMGEKVLGVDKRRALPQFARRTYLQTVAKRAKTGDSGAPGPEARGKVAFFLEVYANYSDPQLADVMDRLLRAHAVEVVYPPQKASGILEMAYGYAERARGIARFNVSQALPYVQEGRLLVSGEPTGSFAFKEHYKDYLGSEDCALVAAATRDLGEFLLDFRTNNPDLALSPSEIKMKVAYHQPCHLKVQKIGSPFFKLVQEVPGIQLVNLDAGCCGMAGSFGMKAGTFDFSMETGRPLAERVEAVAPDIVISECSSCRMQVNQATGRKTQHPAELLAQAYGI